MDEETKSAPPIIDAETVDAIKRMGEAAKEAERNGER